MSCKIVLFLALPIALSAPAALAAEDPPASSAAPANPPTQATGGSTTVSSNATNKSKSDPNRLICRSTSDSSSRLDRGRVCHTAAEWEQLRREARQDIEHIQNARAYNQ